MDIKGIENLIATLGNKSIEVKDFTIWYALDGKDGRIVHINNKDTISYNKEEGVVIITKDIKKMPSIEMDLSGGMEMYRGAITGIQIIPVSMIQSIDITLEEF